MRRGTFLATVALLIAIAGAIVAFAAYFKHRSCSLCDDFDEGMLDDDMSDLDYYATQVDEEEDEGEDMDVVVEPESCHAPVAESVSDESELPDEESTPN